MPAKVIMFDGPDGVGKTTQLQAIKLAAEQAQLQVYAARINGGTPFGEALRAVMLSREPRTPIADLHVAIAMAANLAHDVTQNLQNYDLILIDRSPLSILAFQVAGSGLDLAAGQLGYEEEMMLLKPDLICVYDAPLDILQQRLPTLAQPGKGDYFEDKDDAYHQRVTVAYQTSAEACEQAILIDASGSTEQVTAATKALIQDKFAIQL